MKRKVKDKPSHSTYLDYNKKHHHKDTIKASFTEKRKMRVLVGVKRGVDYAVKVRVNPNGKSGV